MNVRSLVFVVALLVLSPTYFMQTEMFDPIGTWNVSTMSEGGAPMNVTVTIAGKPGAYTGRAITPQGTLPLQDVAMTASGMIALFNWAPRGVVVMKIDRTANGGHTGAWAGIQTVYPLTAKRAQ
jgi:hypothetical protein